MTAAELKAIRDEMGISQRELANLLGMSRITISQYELGKREPKRVFVLALAALQMAAMVEHEDRAKAALRKIMESTPL